MEPSSSSVAATSATPPILFVVVRDSKRRDLLYYPLDNGVSVLLTLVYLRQMVVVVIVSRIIRSGSLGGRCLHHGQVWISAVVWEFVCATYIVWEIMETLIPLYEGGGWGGGVPSSLLTGSPSPIWWWYWCWWPRHPWCTSPCFFCPAVLLGSLHPGYWGLLPPWKGSQVSPGWHEFLFLYDVDSPQKSYRLPQVTPKIISMFHPYLVVTHNGIGKCFRSYPSQVSHEEF